MRCIHQFLAKLIPLPCGASPFSKGEKMAVVAVVSFFLLPLVKGGCHRSDRGISPVTQVVLIDLKLVFFP